MVSMNGFFVKQDSGGVWNWIGIVSNNWVDKQIQWISAKAHQEFVELIDSGKYGDMVLKSWLTDLPGTIGELFKGIAARGKPDLWYWHLPVPIGYTDTVAYDNRGYLIATGRQKEGELYSSIFKAISESDIDHGMSHGMPTNFLRHRKDNDRVIDAYLSTEFTSLPADAAANIGTSFGVALKEAIVHIPGEKKERMIKVFGEETVAQMDALLGELEVFAVDLDIPRKETDTMSDTVTETVAEVEEVEEVETEETEVVGEETENADESVASESGETEGEKESTGMAMDPATFKVPTNMKEFADELMEGMKQVFTEFNAQQDIRFAAFQNQLDEQRAEVAQLKETDGKKMAQKAAETPIASMAGWLAAGIGSVVKDDSAATLNGNKERGLFNKSKEGESTDSELPPVPGVSPFIAQMMRRQQGRSRQTQVPGLVDNGQ